MLTFLVVAAALAAEPQPEPGTLDIDSRLPAEILLDGRPIAELYQASRIQVDVPAGEHTLKVYTNGNPEEIDIEVAADDSLMVLIGRTGLSIDAKVAEGLREVPDAPVAVQVRMSDSIGAKIYVDRDRYMVGPNAQLDLQLPAGSHKVSVRSDDGTVVWATGTLSVDGPDAVVVQLSEGRMPEVSGQGSFSSGP